MPKKYDLVILPGRFQPLHLGHIANGERALELGDNVLFLVGSANQPRTIKNPFTFAERVEQIYDVFPDGAYSARGIEDFIYNDNRWVREVQSIVRQQCGRKGIDYDTAKIAIMGHEKDESSYYLRFFPSWTFGPTAGYTKVGDKVIDATKIRELMFTGHLGFTEGVVHPTTFALLSEFILTAEYRDLVEEYKFIEAYKKAWETAPYAPTFNTVDAVVVQGGHVLLVRRKAAPGKGLWALPGGFLNGNTIKTDGFLQQKAETFREGCLRELREETKIKVPKPILDANITYQHCFDHPDRSLRGRTITQAFLIELPGNETGLPKVKGSDDADCARFFTFDEIENMSNVMFEDHFSIVQHMLARTS